MLQVTNASREDADPQWPHPCMQEPAISPVAVQPRNNHLTGVHLMGVYLTGVRLTGVYLMGVHFIGVYLIGVYLTGVHLMGVYLITLFRGCTATGDIAGSCLQECGRCGSAALPASVIEMLKLLGSRTGSSCNCGIAYRHQ